MIDMQYDDGLVHCHNWATQTPLGSAARRDTAPVTEEPDHDDGLVHSHNWACGERGVPAH